MNPTPQPLFNPQALTAEPTPAQLKEFHAYLRAVSTPGRISQLSTIIGLIIGVAIAIPAVFFALFSSITAVSVASPTRSFGASVAALLPFLLVVAVVAFTAVVIVVMVRKNRKNQYRFFHFARDNNMSFINSIFEVPLPGMIFSQGHSRRSDSVLRGSQPRFVEFANYQYTTGSGKNSTTHRWGYVAVKLDVPLPHIVLDAVANNLLFGSNLPVHFPRDQHLSLEGNFDNYFRLYCPEGYERDALYLFTPDILARLMDNVSTLDVEIVDDWLFLYRNGKAVTLDQYVWHQLFTAVASLLEKIQQWSRWRDDRLRNEWHFVPGPVNAAVLPPPPTAIDAAGFAAPPPAPGVLTPPAPGVAPQGRRLRRGMSGTVVLIIVAGVAIFFLLPVLGAFVNLITKLG